MFATSCRANPTTISVLTLRRQPHTHLDRYRRGFDVIDLPTARMKATGVPFVSVSSIKGGLRYVRKATAGDATHVLAVVEPETGNASDHARVGYWGRVASSQLLQHVRMGGLSVVTDLGVYRFMPLFSSSVL